MKITFRLNILFSVVAIFSLISGGCQKLRQAELERNRSLWRDSKIENYKMTIKIQKPGHATPGGTYVITVRDYAAKSIKPVNNPDVEMLDTQIQFGRYYTIEDIFNFIESAEKDTRKNNNGWSRHEIEYDAKFGYPKKVDLDQSGVMDDELYFEVLEFEVLESTEGETAEKPSPPRVITVPASEITKIVFSVRSREGSDKNYKDDGGMSFSKDGTAFRSYIKINYEKSVNGIPEWKKYQGVASQEQFQKLAQTLAENDFSTLKDSTEQSTYSFERVLVVTYAGKTKSIKLSNNGKDPPEIEAIRQAIETLKNEIDWKQIE